MFYPINLHTHSRIYIVKLCVNFQMNSIDRCGAIACWPVTADDPLGVTWQYQKFPGYFHDFLLTAKEAAASRGARGSAADNTQIMGQTAAQP